MNTTEQNIRNYLKTFTVEDIANSVYLFGINFDTAPIDYIMQSLSSLYEEVRVLKDMVDRDFNQKDGELVRLPKDRASQEVVIRDYYRKESALLKALSNEDIYNAFVSYKMTESKKNNRSNKININNIVVITIFFYTKFDIFM